MLSLVSPFEVQLELCQFVKSSRKAQGYSVAAFSKKTGVPNSTIRKFENTGEISLRQFLMLYAELANLSDIQQLTKQMDMPTSIDEVIKNAKA